MNNNVIVIFFCHSRFRITMKASYKFSSLDWFRQASSNTLNGWDWYQYLSLLTINLKFPCWWIHRKNSATSIIVLWSRKIFSFAIKLGIVWRWTSAGMRFRVKFHMMQHFWRAKCRLSLNSLFRWFLYWMIYEETLVKPYQYILSIIMRARVNMRKAWFGDVFVRV